MNNDFWSWMRSFQDLPMIFISDQVTGENHWQNTSRVTKKIIIRGSECIILFLTRYFMTWTYNSIKYNHWLLISPLSPRIAFSDLALWRHHSWSLMSRKHGTSIVMSYLSTVLAHANWHKGDLHWWIITANIEFSPSSIHGLPCKKIWVPSKQFSIYRVSCPFKITIKIDSFVQDWGICITNTLEIPQSYTKTLSWFQYGTSGTKG